MDLILQKFTGKINAQSLLKTVEELKIEYIDDGLTKEDIPPILGRLMIETQKFKKLPGWSSEYCSTWLNKLMKATRTQSLKLFSKPLYPQWLIVSLWCSKRKKCVSLVSLKVLAHK